MRKPKYQQTIDKLIAEKNKAYAERNLVLAMFAHRLKDNINMGFKQHSGEAYEDGWNNMFIMSLPTGQVSWHIHDSELNNFMGFGYFKHEWDGHSTDEKYNRVKRYIRTSI